MKTDSYGDPEYFQMDLDDTNVRDAINSLLPPTEGHDQWVGIVSSDVDGGIIAYAHPDNAQRIINAMNREIFVVAWTGGLEEPSFTVRFSLEGAQAYAHDWIADKSETDTVEILLIDPETGAIEKMEIS